MAATGATACAQSVDTSYVRAHYTKREVRIPMRDGVTLFTSIYTPRDTSREWEEILAHPDYDTYWATKNTRPHLVAGVRPALLVVGGWYDAEDLFGALATYRVANAGNPAGDVRLVMGPWSHGQ